MTNTALAITATDKLRQAAAADEAIAFRAPPHNIEAEQALLGAILINNEAHDRVSGFLDPEHFYDPLHGRLYETIAQLILAGKQATPVTVKTFFENAEPINVIYKRKRE
jgi:replicative DNA helicase